MGTRSIINVLDGNAPLVAIYQQYDGYPSNVGKQLAEFLAGITMIDGISGDQEEELGKFANGIECLAAQLVARLKTRVGGTYLMTHPVNAGQEYEYDVTLEDDNTLRFEAFSAGYGRKRKSLFKGTPAEAVAWCLEYEGDD